MPLSVEELERCAEGLKAAGSDAEAAGLLAPVLGVLGSRAELDASFRRGSGAGAAQRDYGGVKGALCRLVDRDASRWFQQVAGELRGVALRVLPEPPGDLCASEDEGSAGSADCAPAACGSDAEGGTVCDAPRPGSAAPGSGEAGSPAGASAPARPRHPRRPWASAPAAIRGGPPASGDASGSSAPALPLKRAAPAPEAGTGRAPPTERSPAPPEDCTWVAVLLAALLPLLHEALPCDQNGVCIMPHPHEMQRQEAPEALAFDFARAGRPRFQTNKICDNCGTRIYERFYFHCSEGCDIDFCQDCHQKSQEVLDACLSRSGDPDRESMHARLWWVIDTMERIGGYVLHTSAASRGALARELAFEWSTEMFEQLVQAAVDVVNAKVVHVQDVKDIKSDERFWHAVGWLQFLYSANSLPCETHKLDEQGTRGPKVEYERFILEGINKCEPISEFKRWQHHQSAKVPDVLAVERFRPEGHFCSFLTHSNLVPVGFRRICLLYDVWSSIEQQLEQDGHSIVPIQLEVPREPHALLERVVSDLCGLRTRALRRPLRVQFSGEEGAGPGVTKEFFQVALRSFLDKDMRLFSCDGQQRTYWFDVESAGKEDAFRACGILLGQAVLNNVLVPNIFPRCLFEKLLKELDSPCARPLWLEDVASVDQEIARTLRHVLDYKGDDIGAVYGEMGWQRAGCSDEILSQSNKMDFVRTYVDWFFHARVAHHFLPLSDGFKEILGSSSLLRRMVDAVQLERIICGGVVPVDVEAIRRRATYEGWTEEEETEYLPFFWEVLGSFTETEKVDFVVFVTASDRVPLRGWQDLQVIVQKNGVGDAQLPSAFTCFSQLLLPKYSSRERLRSRLLTAVANSEGFGLR